MSPDISLRDSSTKARAGMLARTRHTDAGAELVSLVHVARHYYKLIDQGEQCAYLAPLAFIHSVAALCFGCGLLIFIRPDEGRLKMVLHVI